RLLSNAETIYKHLKTHLNTKKISFTGAFRRKCETLENVELIAAVPVDDLSKAVEALHYEWKVQESGDRVEFLDENACPFVIYSTTDVSLARDWWLRTGSSTHIQPLEALQQYIPNGSSELEICAALGLAYIELEFREGLDEIEWVQTN